MSFSDSVDGGGFVFFSLVIGAVAAGYKLSYWKDMSQAKGDMAKMRALMRRKRGTVNGAADNQA